MGRRGQTGGDRLGRLAAGLTEVGVEIGEPGRHDDTALVGVPACALKPRERIDAPAPHDELSWPLPPGRRIDEPRAREVEVDRPADLGTGAGTGGTARDRAHLSLRSPADVTSASTAIRIATPFATCFFTSDRGPLATSGAISTPSFIGPG